MRTMLPASILYLCLSPIAVAQDAKASLNQELVALIEKLESPSEEYRALACLKAAMKLLKEKRHNEELEAFLSEYAERGHFKEAYDTLAENFLKAKRYAEANACLNHVENYMKKTAELHSRANDSAPGWGKLSQDFEKRGDLRSETKAEKRALDLYEHALGCLSLKAQTESAANSNDTEAFKRIEADVKRIKAKQEKISGKKE